MAFVKNTEICILCLTESPHLSAEMYQQCCSVWSKWKRFQSPQSARVTLYLGHTNWETGDAKWHHYPTKCSPSFDFLCISVVLFQALFIQDGNLQSGKIKEGMKRAGHRVRVWSEVLGGFALLSEDQTSHSLIWSDLGGTLKWGHGDYRGWLVSKWLGYEWEHSLHRKYQTGVVSRCWIIHKKKNLATPKCYWCHRVLLGSLGHQKGPADLITAFLTHRVMGHRDKRGDKSRREMCLCRNNKSGARAGLASCLLYIFNVVLLRQFQRKTVGELLEGCAQNYRFSLQYCAISKKTQTRFFLICCTRGIVLRVRITSEGFD